MSPVRLDKLLTAPAVLADPCAPWVAVSEAAQRPEVHKEVPVPCSPHNR